MTAPAVSWQGGRKIVGKLDIAHVSASHISPLKGIVREHTPVGDVRPRYRKQHAGIHYALAGKAAAVKQIHVDLSAQ